MALTKSEYELLEVIVTFGGVVTRGMVQMRFNVSVQRANFLLHNLVNKGFIKHVAGISSVQPSIYQVTFKACKLFGQPHSHMRKKHGHQALRRKLVKAHFLFQNVRLEDYIRVSNSEKRIKYLNALGIDNSLIPRKINKGDAVLQIEEPFLLLPPFAPDGGICVVLVDMIEANPLNQLRMVVDRYVPIINSRVVPVSFLAVVENELRMDAYPSLYDKHIPIVAHIKPKFNVLSIETEYDFCCK